MTAKQTFEELLDLFECATLNLLREGKANPDAQAAARLALVEYVREMVQDIDAVEQLICESAPLVWIHTAPSHEDYGQRMAHAARWEKAAYTWLHRHDKSELDEVPR